VDRAKVNLEHMAHLVGLAASAALERRVAISTVLDQRLDGREASARPRALVPLARQSIVRVSRELLRRMHLFDVVTQVTSVVEFEGASVPSANAMIESRRRRR